MLDRGRDLAFVLEAAAELGVVGKLGRDDLQRDRPRGPQLLGPVDDAHATTAGDALDHEAADLCPGAELAGGRDPVDVARVTDRGVTDGWVTDRWVTDAGLPTLGYDRWVTDGWVTDGWVTDAGLPTAGSTNAGSTSVRSSRDHARRPRDQNGHCFDDWLRRNAA